jgi:lambda repressor-like predicted transcriptional regulator
MNKLSTAKRAEVIGLLCEGMSMRAICRTTGVARQTISDLLENVGQAASDYQARMFINLSCKVIECDEIWSFCYSKQKNITSLKNPIKGARPLDMDCYLC